MQIDVRFAFEQETKGAVRYSEVDKDGASFNQDGRKSVPCNFGESAFRARSPQSLCDVETVE